MLIEAEFEVVGLSVRKGEATVVVLGQLSRRGRQAAKRKRQELRKEEADQQYAGQYCRQVGPER